MAKLNEVVSLEYCRRLAAFVCCLAANVVRKMMARRINRRNWRNFSWQLEIASNLTQFDFNIQFIENLVRIRQRLKYREVN
jgi:hypothetical protein